MSTAACHGWGAHTAETKPLGPTFLLTVRIEYTDSLESAV